MCFLSHKNDAFDAFKSFIKRVQKEKGFCITSVRSDHETKFENKNFEKLYDGKDIDYNFLASRTPK